MITIEQKTSKDISVSVAMRVRKRRKELKLTQEQLSSKAGMSLASYKRFEQKGLIAFDSLIRVAIALSCEDDFDALFAKRGYASIEEVIREQKH
ncbi:MAG: helix-turn-helix transcriptional regulator [Raoultibacter sp.]